MGSNSIHLTIHPEIERLGRDLAKKMGKPFSAMISSFIVQFAESTEKLIEKNGNEYEVFFELSRKLDRILNKLKFKV